MADAGLPQCIGGGAPLPARPIHGHLLVRLFQPRVESLAAETARRPASMPRSEMSMAGSADLDAEKSQSR
jgi:hypothetical protein